MTDIGTLQSNQLELVAGQLAALVRANEERMDRLRGAVEERLRAIQEDNGRKLEEMRLTVDEKLHAALETRLGESFRLVTERLEQVHRGLGEMQSLAAGVGDLKRVLTNVKVRGTWGEIRLAALLEEILTPGQYAANVATKRGSGNRVEYAVRLPGRNAGDQPVWLPIDAKFPQEDYQRLLEAQEQANPVLAEEAARALENRVRLEARTIRDKYLDPPQTTDFAILFLPTESLFAEVLRRPGLAEGVMRDFRVVLTGPTTLAALLNSLQMGFRTLAVERRSSEVWALLGTVKTEFGRFADLLEKTRKKLSDAGDSLDRAAQKSRAIGERLREVPALPESGSSGAAAITVGAAAETENGENSA